MNQFELPTHRLADHALISNENLAALILAGNCRGSDNSDWNVAAAATVQGGNLGLDNAFWTKIGAAWSHEEGAGFNTTLKATPIDGKLSLRKIKQGTTPNGRHDERPNRARRSALFHRVNASANHDSLKRAPPSITVPASFAAAVIASPPRS
ncbi:hypothetical protein NOJ05_29465 [Neorhizobium galegae]|uniref:hypothetical protein n=1 Tax=Neorhizobium galegae TaxID=399 RepID=UPI00062817F2|nr:hypothetical protein [Neorhizobium galegae]MCQ1766765.1 hypothetical protein [Neorhizobium galegae]MCQ1781336.1 hypothetical protein [Neorhizobium galegae]MCQ1797527.1 hypothetical protein [Neorhizobium galegae]MCQ1849432.1 hypothetical protein [Neorhizobium galegae]